jgi:SAM-dependent methyltransferase
MTTGGRFIVLSQMKRNKQLNRFFIRDFNKDPSDWAEKDNTFDAVVCCVSVQYMQQPERVFAEIHRVLKPGGVCIMTFSSRLFYSKAIQGWRDNSAYGRVSLVKQYFQCIKGIGRFTTITC